MTDKSKRLEKILKRKGIKSRFKQVDSLENSDFVLLENKRCRSESSILKTEDYKDMLDRGETYPPDIVYFLSIANKRNTQTIKNVLTMNKNMY